MLKYVVMTSGFFAAKLKEWIQTVSSHYKFLVTADGYSMLVSLAKLQDGDCCYC